MENKDIPNKSIKKKKSIRCKVCKKKNLTNVLCKCNKYYCLKHIQPEVHECSSLNIHKENQRKNLSEKLLNEKVEKLKLDSI